MSDLSGLLPGYFFYGLSYIFLGVLLTFQPRRGARSELTDSLWFLGVFGVLHGCNEWLEMLLASGDLGFRIEALLRVVSGFVHTMALLCLFQFSVNLLFRADSRLAWVRWMPVGAFGAWLVMFFLGATFQLNGYFRLFMLEESLRYGLGLMGGILAGYALVGFKADSVSPVVRRLLICTAVFFCINAIISIFAASDASFRGWFGLTPLRDGGEMLVLLVFRAVCAMLIAITIVYALMRMDLEQNELLERQGAELLAAHQALSDSYERLRETQRQLVQSEKMSAVGTLVSGLAHEYNNILSGLKGFTQLARMSDDVEQIHKDLMVVEESTDRAIEITRNLLSWVRPDKRMREPVDANTVVQQTVSLVEATLAKSNIAVSLHLNEVPDLLVSKAELQDIVLNLIINAAHAIGSQEGGAIEISTSLQEENVVLEVADNGCGIPEDNINRIFLPFFTTKGALGGSETPGTGLGLYVVYGIVQSHGGDVSVESEAGRGTTFRVFLPVPDPDRAQAEPPPLLAPAEVTDEASQVLSALRVLVVDDEPTLREAIVRFLEPRTARVVAAASGQEAIGRVSDEPFDLILLDLMMPGLNGLETLRRLRQAGAQMPVFLMTGRVDDDIREQVMRRGAEGLIRKPFELQELAEVLRPLGEHLQVRRSMA